MIVNKLMAANASKDPITAEFLAYYESGTTSSSYTFSNVNINSEGLVVLFITSDASGTSLSSSSVTVDGVSIDYVDGLFAYSTTTTFNLCYSFVSTGSDLVDIVVSFNASVGGMRLALWKIQNYTNTSPTQIKKTSATGGTGLSVSLSVNDDSVLIASIANGTPVGNTLSEVAENYDGAIAGRSVSSAGGFAVVEKAGTKTVSASYATTSQPNVLVALFYN